MQEQVDDHAARDIVGHYPDPAGEFFKFFDGKGFRYVYDAEEEKSHHRVGEFKPP